MKKTFTLSRTLAVIMSLLLWSGSAQAQSIACETRLQAFTRTFEYLTEGTSIPDIQADCGNKGGIPIGFTFRFGTCNTGTAGYSSLTVGSKGWLKFGPTVAGCQYMKTGPTTTNTNIFPGLWPLWGSVEVSGAAGTATYLTETLPSGTKLFTLECRNWRIYETGSTTNYNVVSFQVKLYEGSNIIEYCYKQETGSTATGPTGAYAIGFGRTSATSIIAPCAPGYDYVQMVNPVSTPILNTTGAYGPSQVGLPNNNQVLRFYTPCCGKPQAGTITFPDSVCACQPFTAKLSGATPSPFTNYGVRYQWQSAPAASGPWVDIAGETTTSLYVGTGICGSADTFLRVITFCDSSGLSDTTDAKQIKLITLPYNCYCYSSATIDDIKNMVNIGNVKIVTAGKDTLLNNGVGTPGFLNKQGFRPYSLFTSLRPITPLNRDTTYTFAVQGITKDTFAFSGSGVALYIDWNKDYAYASSELAAFQVISGTSNKFTTTFTVPSWAKKDTLGMRVVMQKGKTTASAVPACGGYPEGETEDYLVLVQDPTCPGPVTAGKAYLSDTSMCDGYKVTVWDTAHARNMTQMDWEWEYSLDNVNWANVVPSSRNTDTITPVVRQNTYYRLRMVCHATNDTVFSNKVFVKRKAPYKCYCYSLADNTNNKDSSDISEFILGTNKFTTGGAHVNNSSAIRLRTDYTDRPAMELYSLDKYQIGVYHTLRTPSHADARISVFIDYNHNLRYDTPDELVWSTSTTATNFYPHDTIMIPASVIPNVETGLRVVLNNDMGTNNPNDVGCDAFTSGEIEDYLVILRRRTTSIGEVNNVDNLQIYPNPVMGGQFTVSFKSLNNIRSAQVRVTSITGQEFLAEDYTNVNGDFLKTYQLQNLAAGVYFVTVVTDGQKTISKLSVH